MINRISDEHDVINPGTGKPWDGRESAVKQTNRIYVNAKHPSRILLPVVQDSAKGAHGGSE